MEEHYEVKFILAKGGNIKIRYSVAPSGAAPEENIVSRGDKPHEDFRRVWGKLPDIARRMLEMPLENEDGEELNIQIVKVNFPEHNDFGRGMQLVVLLSGFSTFKKPLQVTTHKYYSQAPEYIDLPSGRAIHCQELLPDEIKTMLELKKEAFDYAYHCKREQPTVDEAQAAYEAGGYPDEKGGNKRGS